MADLDVGMALRYWSNYVHYTTPPPPEYTEVVQQIRNLHGAKTRIRVLNMGCCGFKEISGISNTTPEEALEGLCLQFAPGANCAYVLFSQATSQLLSSVDGAYGFRFAKFLTDNNLGEIEKTIGPATNPNSGNKVVMFAWKPDPEAVKNWFLNRYPLMGPYLYGAARI